jgi:hypothetical protein
MQNKLAEQEWSFSRINTYYNCPKSFYLKYIAEVDVQENAFAQWGSLCHYILEKFYKEDYSLYELSDRYKFSYPLYVTEKFPYNAYANLDLQYYIDGKEYFANFDDIFDGYNIVGVEQKFETEIGGYKFRGYIDLILENNGKYYICDHKSKSKFSNKKELSHYLYQLYLYSKYIYERFGAYPESLIFNLFRSDKIVEVSFDYDEYIKAIHWAETIIQYAIYDVNYYDKVLLYCLNKGNDIDDFEKNDYFCNNICSVRSHCERSNNFNWRGRFGYTLTEKKF